MTVKELSEQAGFAPISLPVPQREIGGVYIGDLLSWVMGRAKENDAWITIMSNINTVAVATLADVSVIVLAEGVKLDSDVIEVAAEKGVNVITSDKPAYETALSIHGACR